MPTKSVSVSVSIYTLTALGIDRYYAIVYPLKRRITTSRTKLVISIIWLISICLSIVQLASASSRLVDLNEYYEGEGDIHVYFCTERLDPQTARGYEVFILIITYVIPLCLLSYTYLNIGKQLWGRKIPGYVDKDRDLAHIKSKRKTVKMLVIIVLMFALCWLPLHIINVVMKFYPELYENADVRTQDTMRILHGCFLWLACANSFVNPLVYVFVNDNFRNDLQKIFRCRCFRKKRHNVSGMSHGSRTTTTTMPRFSSLLGGSNRRSQKSSRKESASTARAHDNEEREEQV
ncbi:tachykinin-like peptides receptor 86C [Glandiceps talaboti]